MRLAGRGTIGMAGLGLLVLGPLPTAAQAASAEPCFFSAVPLDAASEYVVDYGRTRVITGATPAPPRFLRRGSTLAVTGECPTAGGAFETAQPVTFNEGRFSAGLLPVTVRGVYNGAYPVNRNSGAAWDGVGGNFGARAGVWLRAGPLSAGLAPEVHYQANRRFPYVASERSDRSPFAYRWHPNIDFPSRHGPDAITTIAPGQSWVRADLGPVGLGFSTENVWLGAAQRMPLLISSTAPGFPHVFLELSRPVDVYVGNLGANVFWGRLNESDHFDFDPDNDRRLFGALVLAFEPHMFPGLHLGIARVHHRTIRPEGMELADYIEAVIDNPFSSSESIGGPNQPGNSLAGVFARWVLPRSGFETYFEWIREDYAWDVEDFLKEPDHSRAYLLGFQKLMELTNGNGFRLWGELAHLEASTASLRSGRGVQTMYMHTRVRQGHTNRGQLLGSWIGPGSTGQVLGLDHLTSTGRIGGYLERVRHDADAYWNHFADRYGVHGYDVQITAALRGTTILPWGLVAAGEVAVARRYNAGMVDLYRTESPFEKTGNVRLDLALSWLPLAFR